MKTQSKQTNPTARRSSRTAFVAALATALAFALPAAAEDSASGSALFRKGSKHVALVAGYGVGFRFANPSFNKELRDVGMINVIPRVGFGISDPVGVDSWYHGNVEILLEGAFLWNTSPHSGFGGGGGTTLRYNFLSWDRFVPYIDANGGLIGMDFELENQSDGFNFNVGAGAGAHWFLTDRTAFTTEVRWQHISNARTKLPNNGINDVLFLGGFSYFWD